MRGKLNEIKKPSTPFLLMAHKPLEGGH